MKVPKIIFKEMSLEDNIELIIWALSEDNKALDVQKYTIDYYPDLAFINTNSTEEEKNKLVREVVTKDYKTYYSKIQSEVNRYNQIWNKYNDAYFKELANYLNVSWPSSHPVIEAKVGLIPVFPRWLADFSFAISTNLTKEKIIETAAHETCHFLWFEKWAKMYPNCPKREYDSPYIPWQYSEMVVDPILNSKEINNVFNNLFKEKAYESFYTLQYKDKYVMEVLKDIYSESVSIEEKIKKGYKYVKEVLEDLPDENIKM